MNHQGLLWNVHCVANVGLRKQLNFKSAFIRSNRSSFYVLECTLKDTLTNKNGDVSS